MHGHTNNGFESDIKATKEIIENNNLHAESLEAGTTEDRAQWGNGMEFLMSCIAMSVGLGNIWRFPFTAFENGGGAFLIPYIIVLILIGRPLYYMEMILGQFSSRGPIQTYTSLSPAFAGVGYGQMIATFAVASYYCSLMALTLFYFISSFAAELPWAKCDPDWGDICFDATPGGTFINATNRKSSSELYFFKTVLNEIPNINDGIGYPDWRLSACLLVSWLVVFFVAMRGVKSSGKASYFLALFPYVIMFTLLIRAVTLEGAWDGIIYFITPQWNMLLKADVWYAAVTQAFYSLNVSFGTIVMYSSYNNFNRNINRDAMIVTTLDTLTSLLAGATIFGILGNLVSESGEPIETVVKGGTGLAFVSYPDAIAKFNWLPQVFAILFFFMLFVLGVGSLVALISNITTSVKDALPKVANVYISASICLIGFLFGLIYVTPGGQFMLNLVDYFGGTFIVFMLAICEVACISWVYGLGNYCADAEFMLNIKMNWYWRLCWGIFAPFLLIFIFIYTIINLKMVEYNGIEYPPAALAFGFGILLFGVLQIPGWAVWAFWKQRNNNKASSIVSAAFQPTDEWGPKNPQRYKEWCEFKQKFDDSTKVGDQSCSVRLRHLLCGVENSDY